MHERTLPARTRPDLRQYRKQAKELVKTVASAEAQARIRRHHPRWRELPTPDPPPAFKLADAQLVIAREHGFASWPRFVEHIAAASAVPAGSSERQLVQLAVAAVQLDAELVTVGGATALIVLLHASGSERFRPEQRALASAFNQLGFATLSVDLLTFEEEIDHSERAADVPLLAVRGGEVLAWLLQRAELKSLRVGLWAMHIGAAAALTVAAERGDAVQAVVSSGGRPDLAGSCLWKVQAPTLLIVAGNDSVGLGFNRFAHTIFPRESQCTLQVLAGADPRLTTPAAREQATALACRWFQQYLQPQEG